MSVAESPSPTKPAAATQLGPLRDDVARAACLLAVVGALALCYGVFKDEAAGLRIHFKVSSLDELRYLSWGAEAGAVQKEAAKAAAGTGSQESGTGDGRDEASASAPFDAGDQRKEPSPQRGLDHTAAVEQSIAAAGRDEQDERDAEVAAAAAISVEVQPRSADQAKVEAQGKQPPAREETQPEGRSAAKATKALSKQPAKALSQLLHECGRRHDLTCFTAQKDVVPGPGQFRFPHFFIIGFQKCATTSLFHHLGQHPQLQEPSSKEPEFFTKSCSDNAFRCPPSATRGWLELLRTKKLEKIDWTIGGFEGSTHYALNGRWLAPQLHDLFPWLRLIISMRDPISQAISMVNHNLDFGRHPPCYFKNNKEIFYCGLEYLDDESRYATSLRHWIRHFPLEQLKIIQYENLTSPDFMAPALREIKAFLEVETSQPSDNLGLYNYRHQRQDDPGWPMLRCQYKQLVQKARRNAQEVVEIVRQYGIADAVAWMANWEAAWQDNLSNNCGPRDDDRCSILVT